MEEGVVVLRVGYSVLREIHRRHFEPNANDYGLEEIEFEKFIILLERKGYIERVLWVNDMYSLKPARLTEKGIELLESNKHFEQTYREGIPYENGCK
ncbi:hypothetical protein H1D32_12585 [Anaerobacillus sp. CMMVII]|uniref:YjcQ family protein n=1 Tax=Anaerobacillus sp. CMMVII TaxID=2755588 RepID=UPI0021B6EC39|nr:YjcQ family protein [Anaerobacillus sp. CMMVII]MCT8138503.1 hypothetical protein [Anaerobacillus sp. CMMVII]